MMKGWRTTAVLVLLGCSVACTGTVKPALPTTVNGAVRFTHAVAGATMVSVVGTFNGWNRQATPMRRVEGTDVWNVEVPLSPGEHAFMYVVNGTQWVVPPLAEDFVTDGFGQTNGIVIVRN